MFPKSEPAISATSKEGFVLVLVLFSCQDFDLTVEELSSFDIKQGEEAAQKF